MTVIVILMILYIFICTVTTHEDGLYQIDIDRYDLKHEYDLGELGKIYITNNPYKYLSHQNIKQIGVKFPLKHMKYVCHNFMYQQRCNMKNTGPFNMIVLSNYILPMR